MSLACLASDSSCLSAALSSLVGTTSFSRRQSSKESVVFAVECSNPLGLLTKVFEDRVVLLCQDPDILRGVEPRERKLRQHVFLFGQGFTSRAVVDDVQSWLSGKEQVKGSQVFGKSIARVDNVDLRVCPDPSPFVISLIPTRCRAQYDDVRERVIVAAMLTRQLEEVQDKGCFTAPRLTANDCRVRSVREQRPSGVH